MQFQEYKKSVISGWIAFLTFSLLSIAYSSYNYIINVNSASNGGVVSSSAWNNIITSLANLDTQLAQTNSATVPTGAVMAFYGTSCPSGWSAADWSTSVKKTDGSSSTLDLRGEFIRGLDSAGVGARWVDSGRGLGSWQKATYVVYDQTNIGRLTSLYSKTQSENTKGWADQLGIDLLNWHSESIDTNVARALWAATSNLSDNPQAVGGSRPRNIALLYCVKN